MTIQERENELFGRWGTVVCDGVVDEASYANNAGPRLVFVLKEVDSPGNTLKDLRTFLREARWGATWNNVARWTEALKNPEKNCWDQLENLGQTQRQGILRAICAMNLKKTPGGSSTNNRELRKAVERDASFLKEQFALYNPDWVICCGHLTAELFTNHVLNLGPPQLTRWPGIQFWKDKAGKRIIGYRHPQCRRSAKELYNDLREAVIEIGDR